MWYMINKKVSSLIFLTLLLFPLNSFAGGISEEYTIEGAGTGLEGSYLIKVTITSKEALASDATFIKCAIHGVLFRGFENQRLRQQQRPMAGDERQEDHADFYADFFQSDLSRYAEVMEGSRQVRMTGKRYRISSTVQIFKEKLHRDLEEKGVIKSLTNGF